MFINEIYILKASDPFHLNVHEEVTVNLALKRVPPCYHTLLTGSVFYGKSPIKNATVEVFDNNFKPLFHTVTDENGLYLFKNILSPGEYKVIATAVGYNTSITKEIRIREHSVIRLSFELEKSSIDAKGIVYGKVLEAESGNPIENATIYLTSFDIRSKTRYKATSNSSGQYLIYNIVPNSYHMIVKRQGYLESNSVVTIENNERVMYFLYLLRR